MKGKTRQNHTFKDYTAVFLIIKFAENEELVMD